MECAAAIHFMRSRGWETVTDACLQHPSVSVYLLVGVSIFFPCYSLPCLPGPVGPGIDWCGLLCRL